MDNILARLRLNDSKKSTPLHTAPHIEPKAEQNTLDRLMTNLNGHNNSLKKQYMDLKDESESDGLKDEDHSSGSDLFTPATESFDIISPLGEGETAEMLRVKQELAAARAKITYQEQELAETRKLKHTMDQAMGTPSEVDFGHRPDVTEQTITNLQSAFNASARPFTSRNNSWHPQDDTRSDDSDALSAGSYNRARGIWNSRGQPSFSSGLNTTAQVPALHNDPRATSPEWNTGFGNQGFPGQSLQTGNQRITSGTTGPIYGLDGRYAGDPSPYDHSNGMRRTMSQYNRAGSNFSNRSTPYGSIPSALTSLSPASVGPINMPSHFGYQPRPIGSPLSPTMSDFTAGSMPTLGSPWSPVSLSSILSMVD